MFNPRKRWLVSLLLLCVFCSSPKRSQGQSSQAAGGSAIAFSPLLAHLPLEQQGDLLMARGAYEQALHTFEQVQPRSATIWNKLGLAYHHLFAMDQALYNYKMAVALNPRYAEAYNNIGAISYGKREFSAAEKAYKRALKFQPGLASVYSNLGTLYFAQSKYKKGSQAYQRALALDPDIFDHRRHAIEEPASLEQRMTMNFYFAELYASAGKTTEALEALRKALEEGFSDKKRLREDKELASLRGTPEFQKLMVTGHLE